MILEKYSFGVGDRFGRQGKAQLQVIINAKKDGINITPVWNKSHREHTIIKTVPGDVRTEADEAVRTPGWNNAEFADALRHDQSCDKYNPNFRQLMHVAYKIAAEMGIDCLNVLEKHEKIISQKVMKNIYERHIKPIFME